MISVFDSADEAIQKTINQLCQDLDRCDPAADEFLSIVEAISKLRASLNPTIIQKSE
jgi:hypothetical protein